MNTDGAVLVVDDSSTMRRIVRNLLRQIGFSEIDEAESGETAMAKLGQRDYALVISDWNMEPLTGLDLLKQVRAKESLGTLPFIMVTAESTTSNVVEAMDAGVNAYIVKPFNAETLRSRIESVLG